MTNIGTFLNTTGGVYLNQVIDTDTGLLAGFNCLFFGDAVSKL